MGWETRAGHRSVTSPVGYGCGFDSQPVSTRERLIESSTNQSASIQQRSFSTALALALVVWPPARRGCAAPCLSFHGHLVIDATIALASATTTSVRLSDDIHGPMAQFYRRAIRIGLP
jgi:hypothetical protein